MTDTSHTIQLPPELQEAILSHLDGASLARARRVCKLWKNCVDNLSKVETIWYEKCILEIPAGTLLLLVGSTPSRTAGTWDQWRALYQRWYRSRFVRNWDVEDLWQQRQFTQSSSLHRALPESQACLLQFCGDEVVLFEWEEIVRWTMETGERLPPRDVVVELTPRARKCSAVINPLITPELDGIKTGNQDGNTYPCLLIAIGNMLFFFTKAGMKSVQLPNFITCLAVWSRTLLIGWVTGAVDLYTLPDDLVNCDRSQLLQVPHRLLSEIWGGGLYPPKPYNTTGAVIVGTRAFLIRTPRIEVWDLEEKLFLGSELYGSAHVEKMVSNGSLVFCLAGSILNWFEWCEDTVKLLPGQTPESVPTNATALAMYGDLLALGTWEGLIYLYHLNETTVQENSKEESSESSDEQYTWDRVLSFKRTSISQKTPNMNMVECALRNPSRTICLTDCDYVKAVDISDNGKGSVVTATGIETGEAWVLKVHMFSWSPG